MLRGFPLRLALPQLVLLAVLATHRLADDGVQLLGMGRGHTLQEFRVHVEAAAALTPAALGLSELDEVGHLVSRPPRVVAAKEPRVGVPLSRLVWLRLEQVTGRGAQEGGTEVRGISTAVWGREGGGGGGERGGEEREGGRRGRGEGGGEGGGGE